MLTRSRSIQKPYITLLPCMKFSWGTFLKLPQTFCCDKYVHTSSAVWILCVWFMVIVVGDLCVGISSSFQHQGSTDSQLALLHLNTSGSLCWLPLVCLAKQQNGKATVMESVGTAQALRLFLVHLSLYYEQVLLHLLCYLEREMKHL